MRTAAAAVLLLAGAAAAQRPADVPLNNATQCVRGVRKALLEVSSFSWGSFEFNCGPDGRLKELFTAPNSPIAKDFASFAFENPRVFDAGPVEVVDGGEPEPELVRKRFGLPFHSGAVESGMIVFLSGKESRYFAPKPFKEPPKGFVVKPSVKKKDGEAEALREARSRRTAPSRLRRSELVIEAGRCRDNARPSLAWRVELEEGGNRAPLVCFVHAAGLGRSCGCRTSTDPR